MNIYSHLPKDWKDLQSLTSKFLSELGYNCEIEKDIDSVRGKINIDVFAENNVKSPKVVILCECKYWTSAIPQTVIHAFRSVVSDIGANYGFLISKKGFQKGAFDASKNTNINLLTWDEFTEYFKEKWIKSMSRKINNLNGDLLTYVGAGFSVFFKKEIESLNDEQFQEFQRLNEIYFNIAYYSMEHNYENIKTKEFELKYFEMNILRAEKEFARKFNSYEDFYIFLQEKGELGISEFDKLFGKQLRKNN